MNPLAIKLKHLNYKILDFKINYIWQNYNKISIKVEDQKTHKRRLLILPFTKQLSLEQCLDKQLGCFQILELKEVY